MSGSSKYTYVFPDIGSVLEKGKLFRIDHITGKKSAPNVAILDRQLLMRTASDNVSALIADLCDLAVAVYVADRQSVRTNNHTARILITLPIRSAKLRERASLNQELQDLLYWFTEDLWSFQLSTYEKSGRPSEYTPRLPLPQEEHQTQVALWSGGLDALAGLYHQLVQEPDTHYTLLGTGSNNIMLGQQKKVFDKMGEIFRGRLKLIQIPIRLKKNNTQTVSSSRARGFVFLLLGAICALQEKQQILYVYENGTGAINLPFRECEVGLDHSRSVHPLSLMRMSNFLSKILDQPFSFENPFMFTTKAEMCQRLLQENPKIAFCTISCDSLHRSSPPQCGYCSSCLLRRQAIAVSGIEDQTLYQITASKERKQQKTDSAHLRAMLAQVDTLRKVQKSSDVWNSMVRLYPILQEIVEKDTMIVSEEQGKQEIIKQRLLHLYHEYVTEWDQVSAMIMRQGLQF